MLPSSGGERVWSVRSMAERAAECVRGRDVEDAFFAAVARLRSLADWRCDV